MPHRSPFFSFGLTARVVVVAALLLTGAGCGDKKPKGPAFDVPSLVRFKIGEVEKRLGAPQEQTSAANNAANASKTWRRNEHVLTVEYLPRNGRVTGLTLRPEDAAASLKEDEKDEFFKQGNLKESDARYSLDLIEDADAVFRFKGARITPAPVRHKVVLRVRGNSPSQLVNVAYSVGGAAAESSLTVPPWELPLEAQTGTVLAVEAAPFRGRGAPPLDANAQITVIIEVDGKVAAQKTASAGGTAFCEWEL